MTFDEYQKRAYAIDLYKAADDKSISSEAFLLKVLGLVGESGEFADKIKKLIRNKTELSKETKTELAKELGDVLWYINALSIYLGYDLKQVAEMNINKLEDRKTRGVVASSGDNR